MSKVIKSKLHKGNFQDSHALQYALKITETQLHHPKMVISIHCLFCIYVGPEPKLGETRQRQQTLNEKDFVHPFRTENYKRHHESRHSYSWPIYHASSASEKSAFFNKYTEHFANTIPAAFGPQQTPFTFNINASIVDIIIGDMFFNPEDHGGITQLNALKLFKPSNDNNVSAYSISRANPLQFRLITRFIAAGLSFRQVETVLNEFKAVTGFARIGCINDTGVVDNARVICGINLQILADILNHSSTWAFSLANDSSTHYGHSYLDNRVRIHRNGDIFNIHIVAIPIYERHTGLNMFNLISKTLDILCPLWRVKLIGLGSDGAANMTGRDKGVITLFDRAAEHKIYRVWCGLHQLDLVTKAAYNERLLDGEVTSILHTLVIHLRAQVTLITEMKSTCPKLTTRWMVLGVVCTWLLAKQPRLFEHLYNSPDLPKQAPPMWWWVVIAVISTLTEYVNQAFVKLQSNSLLICQQTEVLQNLATDICIHANVDGPHEQEALAEFLTDGHNSVYGRFSISYKNSIELIFDQGLFIRGIFNDLNDCDKCKVVRAIGDVILFIIDGILAIQAERDVENDPGDSIPPVLPHELVKLRTGIFGINILHRHLPQLKKSWSDEQVAQIEYDHRELRAAYNREPQLQTEFAKGNYKTTFRVGWDLVKNRFTTLRDFCGGIATVFANTASVESDFSILGWEKDEHRLSLTDLALEGVMQCKQHELLKSLSMRSEM